MSPQGRHRSVFGAPDQDEIISRLDAVESDDDGGSFFDARSDELTAAHEAFAAGIAALGGVEQSTPPAAEGPPPAPLADDAHGAVADGHRDGHVTHLLEDSALRAAFILGGPAAVIRDVE